MRVCVALVLVLALSAAGSAAERRGFAADFQRRAAAHVNAANGRGSSSPRFAALAEAMNAGLPGSSGSGSRSGSSGGHKHRRPAYDPAADSDLSLPALDYAPKAALTPLSLQSPLPTLRAQDLASTTLTAPWPDPIAPSAADIPHAVAPPAQHAVYAPRFRQLSGSGDSSESSAAAGAAADAVNSIVSPDGGALSPLRPHEPAFDAAPPPSRRHGRGDGAAPYRHVIPIELTDAQLEAAQHPPSDAELMRFATRRRGGDKNTPMAFTNSGPIAPYGPLARHHSYQNKRRNIFGKRVTIQLPIAGSADAQASVAARTAEWKAMARANVKGGPFDADNAEVDAEELDDEPQLTHRAPVHHSANVAAPPPQPFDAAEADTNEAVDATDAVFLQTGAGTVSQQRARHFGRSSGGAPPVMRAGDTLLYRVDPRGRRHSSTHFRHRYREDQASREAAEADASDESAQARAAAFVSMRERARVERDRKRSAAETLSSPLELPARNAPRPHAHFPDPPLNLDSFDPFEGGRGAGKRLHSPSRPMPPPMVRGPAHAKPNPRGTLQASAFLATHATAGRADAQASAKGKAQAKGKAKAKAAEAKAAEAAKAAAKKLAQTKAKAAADAAAKKAAAAKAKAAAEKAAAAQAAAQAAAAQSQAQALALAQAQAAAAGAAAPVDMLRLMQRLEADAGVDAAALTAGSAAAQLQALRRIEGAVRAAEERLALQAQVDALQAQVSGLMQLQVQRQQQALAPQPLPAVSLMETAATAQVADAADATEEAEADATDATDAAESETETEAAAETEAEAETESTETEAAEGEAQAEAEAENADASPAAPADAEAALAAAEAAADADAAAEVESGAE